MSIGPIDLGIVVVYLLISVAIGIWLGRGSKTVSDYTLGNRNQPWWLVMIAIVATETSSVTLLSIPGFAWSRDFTWLQLAFGFLIGRVGVALLLLPGYFRGRVSTAYELLARRFGGTTRQVASGMFILTRCLADGLRLFLTAIVLQEMTGLPIHWSVVAMGILTMSYCYHGGIRADLWTDFFQLIVYVAGGVVAFWVLVNLMPGGLDQILSMGEAAGKTRVFDFSFDPSEPYAIWAGLLGGVFITLGSHGVDQLSVQRLLCARDQRQAARALWVSGIVIVLQFAFFLLLGLGLWAFYELYPVAGGFDRPDRIFAHFIFSELPVGVVGLLIGAIFAAAMSTLSSSLNSCATVAAQDLLFPHWGERLGDERRRLRIVRWLTGLFGLAQIAVGIGGQWLQGTVVAGVLGIAAFTTGIVLGIFLLGSWAPRVGQRAALAGLVGGLLSMTAIYFWTPLAWPWYGLVGSALTFGLAWLASYRWPRVPAEGPVSSG